MRSLHNPLINLRYWVLISLVSIFGTNTGDLAVRLFRQGYEALGLGRSEFSHIGPLPVLILAYVVNFLLEKRSLARTELYFWVAIILIRTAATNIADSLFDDLGIKFYVLAGVLSALMLWAALRWQSLREQPIDPQFVPTTNYFYWSCMLLAGVLGTVVGDELWHSLGLAQATAGLSLAMLLLVLWGHNSFLKLTAWYWFGVVFARIAGTAAGDWLAKSQERGGAGFDIYQATLLSGAVFFLMLFVWKANDVREQG